MCLVVTVHQDKCSTTQQCVSQLPSVIVLIKARCMVPEKISIVSASNGKYNQVLYGTVEFRISRYKSFIYCDIHSSKCNKGVVTCKPMENCGTCPGNQVWTKDGGICSKTCENLHLPCLYSTAKGGCHCANDTVWDSSINRCVLATQCPCKFNGRSYANGNVISRDCNKWYVNLSAIIPLFIKSAVGRI